MEPMERNLERWGRMLLAMAVLAAALLVGSQFARGAVRQAAQPASCWQAVQSAQQGANAPAGRERWAPMMEAAGAYFALPPGILVALTDREQCGPSPYPQGCKWNPAALSASGARGLGQVLPRTTLLLRGIPNPTPQQIAQADALLHVPAANACWTARIFHDALAICERMALALPGYQRAAMACALSGYYAGTGVADYVGDVMHQWRG